MDDGAAIGAILFWLSPILVPILAAFLLVIVLPLLVGLAVAVGTAVARSVYWLNPRRVRPREELRAYDSDPWSRLIALDDPQPDANAAAPERPIDRSPQ